MNCFSVEKLLFALKLCLPAFVTRAQRVDFNVNKNAGCAPLQVTFTNTSTGFAGGAIYKWEFGNGNTSELQSPSAIFYQERDYDVTLSITVGDKVFTQTKKITVYKKPEAGFTINETHGCLPWAPTFTSTSTSVNPISSYAWDFGDGSTVVGRNATVTHTYNVDKKATVMALLPRKNRHHMYLTRKECMLFRLR
jgi:PKD repeat protein